MLTFLDIVPVAACLLLAFSVGSNDTSNSLSISIGCGIVTLRRALFSYGFFVLAGALLSGQRVMKTTGSNIVHLELESMSIALAVSALLIIGANTRRFPLSTLQVVVGSLAGAAVAKGGHLNVSELIYISICWFISPLSALITAFIFYHLMEKTISSLPVFMIERLLKALLFVSSSLIAYNTGANELSAIIGPLVYSNTLSNIHASAIGAIFMFAGAYLLSHRVIETVGKGLCMLDPYSGFAAQFSAGIVVLSFTQIGMPVSTTYCIIGAISGVGMVKNMRAVGGHLIKRVLVQWLLSPVVAFAAAYAASFLI